MFLVHEFMYAQAEHLCLVQDARMLCEQEKHVYAVATKESFVFGVRPFFDASAPWFHSVVCGKKASSKQEGHLAKARARRAAQAVAGEQAAVKKSPVLEAIRRYPRRIMLAAGAFLSVQVTFYILIAFVIAYGLNSPSVELTRDEMLTSVLIAAAAMIPALFYFSGMSDRVGRKQIYRWGAILTGVWGFALFPLIDTGSPFMITLAVTVGMIFLGMQYGPQAAYFTELFSTEVRYSGASLGYQIGAILGGALAPTIAVLLWTELGIFYVSLYILLAASLTLWSLSQLEETGGRSL
mgnify:CR=1 FL=1